MPRTRAQLPDDIEALKALLVEQMARHEELDAHAAHLQQENRRIKAEVLSLKEQLILALARRYAASSEKISPDQIRLFDEAEAAEPTESKADEREEPSTIVAEHARRQRGRRPLPAALPRIEVVHELEAAERRCERDGAELTEIGEVTSEQLDIIPAQVRVIRHVRKQYACRRCGECVKTAPLPVQPIPKSLASPGLLAHVVVSKYQDALPLYRQEQILARIGIELPRATLSNWMVQAGQLIQPLINLMRERLQAGDLVQMDETTVQVLKEPGKRAQSKSYLWVQRGGPPDHPLVLYEYDPSRSQRVPERLLEGFSGYLQTDGYDGYNAVAAKTGIVHVGCWAHARRKFNEAVKTQGKARSGRAWRGLSLIQKLYRIEQLMKEATPEARHAYRQAQARPLLAELREWLDSSLPQVPPKSATGKALNYLHNEWPKLIRYLEDGRLPIDNNLTENAIRPFVVGRKNWLFSDSVRGVKASANLYSLIETAKANGIEPYAYLRHLFTELPCAKTAEDVEALLPDSIDPHQIAPR